MKVAVAVAVAVGVEVGAGVLVFSGVGDSGIEVLVDVAGGLVGDR